MKDRTNLICTSCGNRFGTPSKSIMDSTLGSCFICSHSSVIMDKKYFEPIDIEKSKLQIIKENNKN